MLDKEKRIKMSEEDHVVLTETIIETEAALQLLREAQNDPEVSINALQTIMSFYSKALKKHKLTWINTLVKYVGEEDASTYRDNFKYDTHMKVIFFRELDESNCNCGA